MEFNETEFYDKYKGQLTCAYKKDIKEIDGTSRVMAKRTQEREKYLFRGLTDDIVLIDCPKDLIAIEFENNVIKNKIRKQVEKTKILEWVDQVELKCKEMGFDYCIADHGGTSPYIYLANSKGLESNQDKKIIANFLRPEEAKDFLDLSNLGNTLIPIMNRPHWKKKYKGAIHKVIRGKTPDKHNNDFSNILNKAVKDISIRQLPDDFPKSDIDDLKVQDVINISGFKKDKQGWNGENPFHGSTTGTNFRVFNEGIAYCRRCHAGISGIQALAIQEGIISNCNDRLRGEDFLKAIDVAKEKYGLKSELEKTKNESNQLKFIWDKDLSNYEEKNGGAWIQDRFYRPKTICLISGKRATLKTWITLHTAYCIAHGIKVFGEFETERGNVLYLDRENGFLELKKRKEMIKTPLSLEGESKVIFLSETFVKLDSYDCLKQLEKFIIENNITFVIGDTYRRLISFEENDANKVSTFFCRSTQTPL